METNEIRDAVKDVLKEEAGTLLKGQVDTAIKEALSAKDAEEEKAAKELDKKFKTFGEVLSAIAGVRRNSQPDNRLTYVDSKGVIRKPGVDVHGKATMVEGTDSAGGFLVPEEFRADIIGKGLEASIFRPGCFSVPMSSDVLRYPTVNDTTHASSTVHGGIIGYWQGEGSTYQESEPVFGNITLTAKKLIGYTKVSEELLADSSISLDPFIRTKFAEAWAWLGDLAILRGTGSGQPLGILNAACLVSVTRQDTDDTLFYDIINIWGQVYPESRDKAAWYMNHECLTKMLRMHAANTTTNAYGAQLVWMNDLHGKPVPTIFGRPVYFTEKMGAQGTVGDIGCFDMSQYMIGERQGFTVDMSNQVYWGTGYVAFKFTERWDGQPMWNSVLTPYAGSATLSPFVTLTETS